VAVPTSGGVVAVPSGVSEEVLHNLHVRSAPLCEQRIDAQARQETTEVGLDCDGPPHLRTKRRVGWVRGVSSRLVHTSSGKHRRRNTSLAAFLVFLLPFSFRGALTSEGVYGRHPPWVPPSSRYA